MQLRTLFLLCALCGVLFLAVAAKTVTVHDKEYSVMPYPEDCSKYLLCEKGKKCLTMSCHPTYVFDSVTGTCTHRMRGNTDCDRRNPRKPRTW